MADSKTVEGEVADFSSQPAPKPDIQIIPPVQHVKANYEQFLEGRIADMYDAFENLRPYTHGHAMHDVMDATKVYDALSQYLKFVDYQKHVYISLDKCLQDLAIVTKSFEDFGNLSNVYAGEAPKIPKSLYENIMCIINTSISQINGYKIVGHEPSNKVLPEETLVNSYVADLAQSRDLVGTILLTRNIVTNISLIRTKALSASIHDDYIQASKELAEFCKGKKEIKYIYNNGWTKCFSNFEDLHPPAHPAQPAQPAPKKGFWSFFGRIKDIILYDGGL